jgi:hypothetical protein
VALGPASGSYPPKLQRKQSSLAGQARIRKQMRAVTALAESVQQAHCHLQFVDVDMFFLSVHSVAIVRSKTRPPVCPVQGAQPHG